jgi:hypothetical protein
MPPTQSKAGFRVVAGGIDEKGYINGMNKKGFDGPRALSELYANGLDALLRFRAGGKILAKITRDYIYICDDGNGMDISGHEHLWQAQRENHSGDKSTGVSGFGAKPSTKKLSKDTPVTYFSKSNGGLYCKSIAPWDKMVNEGKYTGMIEISEMDDDEIKEFIEIAVRGDRGTVIKFQYTSYLQDEILKQFDSPKSIKESNQRLDCIYSKFSHTVFELEHYENIETKTMKKYNYFAFPDSDYYLRKSFTIGIYEDSRLMIVFAIQEGHGYKHFENKGNGGGWRKYDWTGHHSAKYLGSFELNCGLLKDKEYFDLANPIIPGASKILHDYEKGFFSENDDNVKADLYYPSIIRNSQYIGNLTPLPKLKPSSGRANGKECIKNSHIRTEINYEINSSQDNIIDDIIGIQENKNQLNTHNSPEGLKRIVEDCMIETSNGIWKLFENTVQLDNALKLKETQDKMRLEKEKQMKALEEKTLEEVVEKALEEAVEEAVEEQTEEEVEAEEEEEEQTDEQTERQADEQTERQAAEQTERQAAEQTGGIDDNEAYQKLYLEFQPIHQEYMKKLSLLKREHMEDFVDQLTTCFGGTC